MCDTDKIAGFIAAASIAVIAAVVIFGIAAVNAGTFWGAFGNGVLMAAAAVSIGLALAAVNVALGLLGQCNIGTCTGVIDLVRYALIAAATALTVLLAATIIGVIGASVPWVGVAVAIALAVAGVAVSVSLGLISANIAALERCVRAAPPATPASTVATIAQVTSMVAGFLIGVAVALGGVTSTPRPTG